MIPWKGIGSFLDSTRTRIFTMSLPTLKLSSSSKLLVLLLLPSVALAGAQSSGAGSSLAPVGKEWTTYNGDPSGRRFSALTQINRDNVRRLQLVWAFPTHGRPIKGTPIEVDGIVYVTAPEKVWAIDAQTG